MTRYLKTAAGLFPIAEIWAQKLAALAPQKGEFRIIDLGSGSGGAMQSITAALTAMGIRPHVTLTDLYPNPDGLAAGERGLRYWPVPVDAAAVPEELCGIRTLLLAFHHHPPKRAQAILRDAFEKRLGIAIFEISARKPLMLLGTIQIPLAVLVLTPLVRPVKASQLFFTYLFPLIPLITFWDGLVSNLRTYSVSELKAMTADMVSSDYEWQFGEITLARVPGEFPWLVGRPLLPVP